MTLITGWLLLFDNDALRYTHAQTVFMLSIVSNRVRHALATKILHKYMLIKKAVFFRNTWQSLYMDQELFNE